MKAISLPYLKDCSAEAILNVLSDEGLDLNLCVGQSNDGDYFISCGLELKGPMSEIGRLTLQAMLFETGYNM